MPNAPHDPGQSPDDQPMVEMLLNVGDSLRIGDQVLRLMDIDGEYSMLRVDLANDEQNACESSGWAELPR